MSKTKTKPKAKAKKGGFDAPMQPDATLAAVIGDKPMSRAQITKAIWSYIRKHNLQNPANKRNILADETTLAFFGKNEITMFELAKLVGQHVTPA